ncbi:MAG TPA: cysteine rich repeat-containing protein [Myxococcales bacterium]|nr:cysteine rich repeat-containing protein [Myxococcales bacterium]
MIALALPLILAAANHPCVADADRLCKGVDPGGGRVARCLKQHEAELSPACKEKRASYREQLAQIQESCREDVEKFCGGVNQGRGAIARCLRGHASQLSEPCKKHLAEVKRKAQATRAAYEKIQMACAVDEQRFCSGVDVGGGAMAACLKKHQPELAVDCKQAIAEAQAPR